MVKTKIFIPEISREFDVAYNENALVCDIISDTMDLVEQYCGISSENAEHFVLCRAATGAVMGMSERLGKYGIVNGEALILI